MQDMSTTPTVGHNNPPNPIEAVIAEFDGVIAEAQHWADGNPVEDENSMKAADLVIKEFKTYRSRLKDAVSETTAPFHRAWKAKVAEGKVYTDDADLIQKALIAVVAPFKAKLAAQKEADRREAQRLADEAAKEASRKLAASNVADIEEQREAAAAVEQAQQAIKAANKAKNNTVKGMRTEKRYEINDMRAVVNFIARNDKEAMAAFADDYVRRNFKSMNIDGVSVTETKEAF